MTMEVAKLPNPTKEVLKTAVMLYLFYRYYKRYEHDIIHDIDEAFTKFKKMRGYEEDEICD